MDATEGLKAHRINFASALEILEAITGDGGEARPNPVAMDFYRLIKQEETGATSWRVWGAFSGERAANAQEKEEGEKLVLAFAAGDSGAIHAYRVRNQIIDAPSGKEALNRFRVDGLEETRHGFCASLIVHVLKNEGIENDRLNALDPCFKPAQPAAESPKPAALTKLGADWASARASLAQVAKKLMAPASPADLAALAALAAAKTPATKPVPAPTIKPGKEPRNRIGQLATDAAWAIERETGQRATPKATMTRLMEWAASGDHGDLRPDSKGRPLAVEWVTGKGREVFHDLDALGAALARWHKSRQ